VNFEPNITNCEEERRLAAEREAATPKFSEAVTELEKKMGTSQREECLRRDRAANEALVRSEQVRLALEQRMAADGG
jgi:hypothetical protein